MKMYTVLVVWMEKFEHSKTAPLGQRVKFTSEREKSKIFETNNLLKLNDIIKGRIVRVDVLDSTVIN